MIITNIYLLIKDDWLFIMRLSSLIKHVQHYNYVNYCQLNKLISIYFEHNKIVGKENVNFTYIHYQVLCVQEPVVLLSDDNYIHFVLRIPRSFDPPSLTLNPLNAREPYYQARLLDNRVVELDFVVQQSRAALNPFHSPWLLHSSLFAFAYSDRTSIGVLRTGRTQYRIQWWQSVLASWSQMLRQCRISELGEQQGRNISKFMWARKWMRKSIWK